MLPVVDHRFPADGPQRLRALAADACGRVLVIGEGPGLDLGLGEVRIDSAADCSEADFPPATFDTIITCWVFCRVADPDVTAAAMCRWLKPDGSLLFVEHVLGGGFRRGRNEPSARSGFDWPGASSIATPSAHSAEPVWL